MVRRSHSFEATSSDSSGIGQEEPSAKKSSSLRSGAKLQPVKEEFPDDAANADDAANLFADVPKGPQPIFEGLVQVKVEEVEKDEKEVAAQDSEDSDVAEDMMHPVKVVAKARALGPARVLTPAVKRSPASKKRKQPASYLAASIITCGWKPLGASYRHSFDDMIFNGKRCVCVCVCVC